MNRIERASDYIIKKAYNNNGCIDFKSIYKEIHIEDLPQINRILGEYGTLNIPLENGKWNSYSLNLAGDNFACNGAFEGLEQRELERIADRKLSRSAKKFSIFAVVIAFIALIVSIVSICT